MIVSFFFCVMHCVQIFDRNVKKRTLSNLIFLVWSEKNNIEELIILNIDIVHTFCFFFSFIHIETFCSLNCFFLSFTLHCFVCICVFVCVFHSHPLIYCSTITKQKKLRFEKKSKKIFKQHNAHDRESSLFRIFIGYWILFSRCVCAAQLATQKHVIISNRRIFNSFFFFLFNDDFNQNFFCYRFRIRIFNYEFSVYLELRFL